MTKSAAPPSYMVCGWYTEDYFPWWQALERDLLAHSQPYDFAPVVRPEFAVGWEATTMLKAREIKRALERHPDKVIVFLDVDCRVTASLAAIAELRGDVGVFWHSNRNKWRHIRAHIRSGTMVFKPNDAAHRFVDRWMELSKNARYGDVDQDSLLLALQTSDVTFEQLDVKWCKCKSDACADPIIIHDSASRHVPKIGTTHRRLAWLGEKLGLTSVAHALALHRPGSINETDTRYEG